MKIMDNSVSFADHQSSVTSTQMFFNNKTHLKTHLVLGEEPDTLQLVENWVVLGVNLVTPVHVTYHEEGIKSCMQQVPLVC